MNKKVQELELQYSRNSEFSKSMSELEEAIKIKDDIIHKLKNNLDNTIEKFNSARKSPSRDQEYTLGPKTAAVSLEELVQQVHHFFNSAPDDEINEFLTSVKQL